MIRIISIPRAFNLFHCPHSWFDLFTPENKTPPTNIEAWRKRLAGLPANEAAAFQTECRRTTDEENAATAGGRPFLTAGARHWSRNA